MKKMFALLVLLFCSNAVFAEPPYIPEHLTNPNYKQPPIDCEKEMKYANPFIGTTIPEECKPKKEEVKVVKPVEQPQPKTKVGKFLNVLLEEY
jgi:hypothetical protein